MTQITQEKKPTEIRVNPMDDNSVIMTFLDRASIFLDPVYQRQSDIWSLEKKQLLIDSVINRFDIPKFYFHEFEKPQKIGGKEYKYASIDGKQRLTAIWGFIENDFPLGDKTEYLIDPTVDLRGLTYSELSTKYPKILARFNSRLLALMAVRTDDTELIEEMFTRLNEAMPLNASEKRNAFGGPLPTIIRALPNIQFFTKKLPFTNKRYRHFDLACKFLYLLNIGEPEDTKKVRLDLFVKEFKKKQKMIVAQRLKAEAEEVLAEMTKVFVEKDPLLRNVGLVVVYFWLFYTAIQAKKVQIITRKKLIEFESERNENRRVAAIDMEKADYELLRFDWLASSLNDKYTIKFRFDALCHYKFPELENPTSEFREE